MLFCFFFLLQIPLYFLSFFSQSRSAARIGALSNEKSSQQAPGSSGAVAARCSAAAAGAGALRGPRSLFFLVVEAASLAPLAGETEDEGFEEASRAPLDLVFFGAGFFLSLSFEAGVAAVRCSPPRPPPPLPPAAPPFCCDLTHLLRGLM